MGKDTMQRIGGANSGFRILVIDDDPDIAELLTTILKPQGFTVYHACDGKDGLKLAYELHPDLIILDIMMPMMDGWDVCARLRELTDIPILILTARVAEADMLRGFVLGRAELTDPRFATEYWKKQINLQIDMNL